jgi:polar amino acid transport system substrate-binding protein
MRGTRIMQGRVKGLSWTPKARTAGAGEGAVRPSAVARALSRRIPLTIALLLLLVPACSNESTDTLDRIQTDGVLQIGTDATYPPFETFDSETGEIVGFDVDLIRLIAGRLGVRAEFQVVPFDGILAALRAGKYDAVISALTITEERARRVLFSRPYYAAGQSIVVRSDSPVSRPDDLKGERIGVQLGTTGERAAQRISYAEVVSFDAIGAALIDLRIGRLDAVIADTPTAALFCRKHSEIQIVGKPITEESYGIAFRLEDEKLRKSIDRILDELEKSGRLEQLRLRWKLGQS